MVELLFPATLRQDMRDCCFTTLFSLGKACEICLFVKTLLLYRDFRTLSSRKIPVGNEVTLVSRTPNTRVVQVRSRTYLTLITYTEQVINDSPRF